MKRILFSLSLAVVLCAGCERMENLESRMDVLEGQTSALEKQLEQLNKEVSLISELLSDKYFVKSVQVTDNPRGYRLVLVDKKGNTKEYQVLQGADGRNGQDGVTPDIGVRRGEDGNYYWTVGGEWLLVGGERVRANGRDGRNGRDGEDGRDGSDGSDGEDGTDGSDGEDGRDGVNGTDGLTPQFKVEDGKWYARLGEDGQWEYVGDATTGATAALFSSIDATSREGVVIFTLADGSTIVLPKATVGEALRLVFDTDAFDGQKAGETRSTGYEVKAPEGLSYTLDSYEPDGWTVSISTPKNNKGTFTVTMPQGSWGGEVFFIVTGADGSCYVRLVHVGQEGEPDDPDDPEPELSVTVTTGVADGITYSTATLKGSYSDATVSVREVGFEWGSSASSLDEVAQADLSNPSAASGSFSAAINGLGDGKTYYYRAYVVLQYNSEIRYFYGSTKSFTTPVQPGPPPVGNQPGWAEVPVINYTSSGSYKVDSEDSSLYYAFHICPDVNYANGKPARNYSVCFSAEMHCPMWVAAPRHQMYVGNSGRTEAYRADPDIPADIQYKSKKTGGGCNKGHMLGSAERTISKETNRQVFYYSNIAPQLSAGYNTGGGGWNYLEDFVDKQVCADTLYEVVGTYFKQFTDGYGKTVSPQIIQFGDRADVHMPTMFYYVLLRTKSGSSGKNVKDCSASELQCVAFVRSHSNELKGQRVTSKEMMSVADLEKITGFTYFPGVPNAPKTTFNKADWGVDN